MPTTTFQCVGLAANLDKPQAVEYSGTLLTTLEAMGFGVVLDEALADRLGKSRDGLHACCTLDVILAVGGDGTILRVAREYADANTPVLGLKSGHLGFLAEARTAQVPERLRNGQYQIQNRMRVSASVLDSSGTERERYTALNDVVVHGSGYSRMVDLKVTVNGQLLREYSADGVIVSTPTGSTAYSLSAGGPVLEPTVRAMVLTPLNPHSLNMRPLVIDRAQPITIGVDSGRTTTVVTIDGQDGCELIAGDRVVVSESRCDTRLVVPADYDFFALLREKL